MSNNISAVLNNAPSAVIIVKDSAIMIHRSTTTGASGYYIFDSHSRDHAGLPTPRGKAMLMKFSSTEDMTAYLHTFISFYGNNPAPYEISCLNTFLGAARIFPEKEASWYCFLCNSTSQEPMIQCQSCLHWVHIACSAAEASDPQYICDVCKF
jgi:hypothetical protein